MNRLKAVTEYLFSDLEEKQAYPYEKSIRKALKILKGESCISEQNNNISFQERDGGPVPRESVSGESVSDLFMTAAAEAVREFKDYSEKTSDNENILEELTEIFSSFSSDKKDKDRVILKMLHPESDFFPASREKGVEELRK